MQLMCSSLLVVFATVSAFHDLTFYKKLVAIANATINLAYNKRITIGDNIESNGLEQVIKMIVDNEHRYNLGTMNLMIAVPEKINIGYGLPDYENREVMENFTYYQAILTKRIKTLLDIDGPTIDEEQKFEDLDLKQLAEERRSLTGIALKNIIRRAIDFENLANFVEERRINPTQTLKIKIADRYKHRVSLSGMCRLIALLMSTKFPRSCIIEYKTDFISTCTLWDGTTKYIYREIESTWWQVNVNNINNNVKLLKEVLDLDQRSIV
ncbi:uncharacterized protein LOC126835634 [Adelges cooleyi]|uniref:uncharacterized protein LOC126835634 n=1 Tax=Adelges cooleyi TaxID=133065 RepID=UPI00217F301F|nr:uncharacterized protein LOC126835634 [Adelges cooleyi]